MISEVDVIVFILIEYTTLSRLAIDVVIVESEETDRIRRVTKVRIEDTSIVYLGKEVVLKSRNRSKKLTLTKTSQV